jgi:16S rRNA G966 N2-methylase RsmD
VAKLSKAEIKAHNEAMALVDCNRPLKDDEKEFILDNWQESANHVNSAAGAFFTPRGLARDLSIEVGEGRIIDLCAGIGSLAYYAAHKATELVCVELNPEYARIGKRVVPEATWLTCSAFAPEVHALGRFDWAISNPPFGAIKADDFKGRYTGSQFEFKLIEQASRLAEYGAFIIPQMSAPFRYSGQQCYRNEEADKVRRFREQTGIIMEMNCGIDTAMYRNDWRGVSPVCEIVVCEFEKTAVNDNLPLFGLAADQSQEARADQEGRRA